MSANSKYFYGYASVFNNKDWKQDIVLEESLNISHLAPTLPLLLEHNPKNKIGEVLKVSQNAKGVFVEGYIYNKYAVKHLPLSIGFIVNKSFTASTGLRYIQKFTLLEVSVVKKSANIKAFGFCDL